MAVSFQLVIDCADPEPLAHFWAAALGYELEPPPAGFASWDSYWREIGVPEDELGAGADCIVDPERRGPRIWFQVVPDGRTPEGRSRHATPPMWWWGGTGLTARSGARPWP
jgi:Glyoxalase-like domain